MFSNKAGENFLKRESPTLNTKSTVEDCLFGAVQLIKNADKYRYSGYSIAVQ